MRIALISDIHGNLVALDAVLKELRTKGIEHILFLGDAATDGPQPRQVLARLQEIGCPAVMGNNDTWLLQDHTLEYQLPPLNRQHEIMLWAARQMTDADKAYLKTFQETLSVPLSNDKILLCYHASPRSNRENLLATTPDDQLEPMLADTSAHVLAGGHTHIQMLRRYRNRLLINPGSVGAVFDPVSPFDAIRMIPYAEYAIVHSENTSVTIELCRIPFDRQAFIQAIYAADMPHAQWYANEWLT